MIEGMMIMSFIMAGMYLPFRGKSVDQLTEKQFARLQKEFERYKNTKKGRDDVAATFDSYLPTLQRNAIVFLILGICLIPIWILAFIFVYKIL